MRTSQQRFILLYFIALSFLLQNCSVTKHKDLNYLSDKDQLKYGALKLDVFSPRHKKEKSNVMIFLHGGGWAHGKRSTYKFFGKRLARKGIVGVVLDYPLSPKANYNDMAIASAEAVKWVKEHISNYGGDSTRIFISGHSAGGHLAALISVKDVYFDSVGIKNPIKGVVLIDAAGLDMYKYLSDEKDQGRTHYMEAFSDDYATWKAASPIYFLHEGIPPMLIFTGGKTYPNITDSNQRFVAQLVKYSPRVDYTVIRKRHHVGMIFQLYNSHHKIYKDILRFTEEQK